MNSKRNWTAEDVQALLAMRELGVPQAQIAQRLGRTKSAVAHKVAHLMKAAPAGAKAEAEAEQAADLEAELSHTQELCDKLVEQLGEITTAVNGNVAAMMEAGAAQAQEITELKAALAAQAQEIADLRTAGESHEAAVKTLTDISDAAGNELAAVREYLSHGAFWRLLHGFEAFMAEARQDEAQG